MISLPPLARLKRITVTGPQGNMITKVLRGTKSLNDLNIEVRT